MVWSKPSWIYMQNQVAQNFKILENVNLYTDDVIIQ